VTPLVLIDTWPLVAFLNRRDRFHQWAVKELAHVEPPPNTCEAVVSEGCFILRRGGGAADPMLELLDRDLVRVDSRSRTRSAGSAD
jgi:hypothetical protein